MKHIKRLFAVVILLTAAAFIINTKTSFFHNIGTYIPYIEENFPDAAEYVRKLSDNINESLSRLPSIEELWEELTHKELPIDPSDVASNVYYSSDTMLNFCGTQNISVSINGKELDVYGITGDENERFLVYRFLDESENVLDQFTDLVFSEGRYRKIMRIPDGAHQFAVFSGPEKFGEFSSTVYNYVYLTQSPDGSYMIKPSPAYETNISLYEKPKSIKNALKSTYSICAASEEIKSLALSITESCASDYDKALAIHDWVCDNIYYDSDSITGSTNTAPYIATDVLETKKAVCLGYANLYAALCRSIDIPCNVVTGYALGVTEGKEKEWNESNLSSDESNHAWNEVYTDGRWVIVDTTWDSKNKIKNNISEKTGNTSHLYFDANIKFFSVNHKILKYIKK